FVRRSYESLRQASQIYDFALSGFLRALRVSAVKLVFPCLIFLLPNQDLGKTLPNNFPHRGIISCFDAGAYAADQILRSENVPSSFRGTLKVPLNQPAHIAGSVPAQLRRAPIHLGKFIGVHTDSQNR